MNGCGTPGCTGSIVDGYCDVCGSPGTGGVTSNGMVAQAANSGSPTSGPAQSASPQSASPQSASPQSAPPQSAGSANPPAKPSLGTEAARGTQARRTRPAPAPPTPRTATVANGTPCNQPGCQGRINTGYCDYCGAPAGAPPASPMEDGGLSTVTRGSSITLQSMALGSRRSPSAATSRRIATSRTRSARLGAGLTTVPPAPPVDASAALMKDPQVAEDKRDCPSCGAAVGRSHDGVPGRTTGFCPNCRNPYSFDPKLQPGDLVAGQYEVAGCLAHGGLGWIYLARDKNVSDRWVVLKGLLNAGDADAMAAAIAEQRFLAQVEHPLIVEIYNFVTHEGAGYTVMEYVGGTSLKENLKQRMAANGGAYSALPVDQALAYLIEVLPAFQYLHDIGLLYCDFKPDNLIQVGDGVKIIDLGGVRRADDTDSAIYGTVGYQAPEVAAQGPSIESDIYTIGRTLIVLIAEFRGYQGRWVDSVPGPDVLPVLGEYDSLNRLIMKCCATNPADRFTSADELRTQMLGVLREVVATRTEGTSITSAASPLFESPASGSSLLTWQQLPKLKVDTHDPQFAWLSNVSNEDPQLRLATLDQAPGRSAEVHLARAAAALEMVRPDLVEHITDDMLAEDPWEWRAVWMSGLAALQHQDWVRAQLAFNAVYGQVPGELAPKLALAVACEAGGEPDIAERLYLICARTDGNYVAPAAFGLARIRLGRGDTAGALEGLDMVPETSRDYSESRRLSAYALLTDNDLDIDGLNNAWTGIAKVRMDDTERYRFHIRVLNRAMGVVSRAGEQPSRTVGPHRLTVGGIRDGLEASYRAQARATDDATQRTALVTKANKIRRWTLK